MSLCRRSGVSTGLAADIALLLFAAWDASFPMRDGQAETSLVCDGSDPDFELLSEDTASETITTVFFSRSAVGTDHEVRMRTRLIVPNNQPSPPAGWPVVLYNPGSGRDLFSSQLGVEDYPEAASIALLTMTQLRHGTSAPTILPTQAPSIPPTSTAMTVNPPNPAPTPTLTATPTPAATDMPSPSATPTPTMTLIELVGDANCDGNVDSIDAELVLQLDAGLLDSLGCIENADVNQAGRINSVDTEPILQFDAGLINSLVNSHDSGRLRRLCLC